MTSKKSTTILKVNSNIILGVDPGLHHTGWGVIAQDGQKLSYVASGTIKTSPKEDTALRLAVIHRGLEDAIAAFSPTQSAVEDSFVNRNPTTSLKLGHARGAILLTLSLASLPVSIYAPTMVKKALVGNGRAEKHQIDAMIRLLLPKADPKTEHAADALAIALAHAHTSPITL